MDHDRVRGGARVDGGGVCARLVLTTEPYRVGEPLQDDGHRGVAWLDLLRERGDLVGGALALGGAGRNDPDELHVLLPPCLHPFRPSVGSTLPRAQVLDLVASAARLSASVCAPGGRSAGTRTAYSGATAPR